MAWLAKNNFVPTDRLKAEYLNSLANDDRNWGGDVNGGGNHLTNVILEGPIGFQFYPSPLEVTPGSDGRSITQYDKTVSLNQLARWATGRDATAEGGANSGSDFFISRFNDAGVLLGTPFTIRRSDGLITMGPQKWTGAVDAGGQTLSNVVIAGMMSDPTTTKGDLITRTTAALARVPIGTDGSILTADAAQANGMRWIPNISVPSTRQVIAGTGMTGGGALTADVTLTNDGVVTFNTRKGAVTLLAADVTGVGGVLNTRVIGTATGSGLHGGGSLANDLALTADVKTVFGRTGDIVLTPTDITGSGGVPSSRKIITGSGLSGGGDLSADVTLAVVDDSTNQRLRVSNAGTLVGTRREINFIPGANITLTPVDNSGSNRLDLTIATIAAQMSIYANSAIVGQTQSLNLNAGANVVISGTMNSGRADITITAAGGGSGGMIDPTQAAGDLIVRSASTTVRFPASTIDNWVLTADSTQPLKMKWALAAGGIADPTTAEGDLLVRSASAVTKLPIGATTGMVLTVDTLVPNKVKWATPAVASQSPWLTNIDGGGFSLSNANTITAGIFNATTGYKVNNIALAAANVVNAVSTLGSYADPLWITSLAYSKITGAPTASSLQTPWLSNIDGANHSLVNVASLGIGVTSPADLMHLKAVSGNVSLRIESVAPGAPFINFIRSSQSWWAGPGLNGDANWCLYDATAAQFLLMATTNGRIAIGTQAAPTGKVDIYSDDAIPELMLHSTVDPNVSLQMIAYGAAKYVSFALGSGCTDDLIMYSPGNGSNIGLCMRNPGGNFARTKIFHNGTYGGINSDAGALTLNALTSSIPVGIGCTSPVSRLSFGNTDPTAGSRIAFYENPAGNAVRGIGMATPSSGVYGVGIWSLNTGTPTNLNMQLFVMDDTSGGRVGIGQMLPQDKLHVATTAYVGNTDGAIRISTPNNEWSARWALRAGANGVPRVAFDGPTAVGSYAESFCIQWTNLYVGIGNIAPIYRLDVAGDVNCTGAFRVNGTAISGGGVYVQVNGGAPGGGTGIQSTLNFVNGTSSFAGATLEAGNLRYNVTFNFSSDIRLKRNVRDLEGGLAIIDRLRPVSFEWNGAGGYKEGQPNVAVIAQELQEVLPDCVYPVKSRLHPDEDETDILCYDPNHILFHLVLAVKQLKQQISELARNN